MCGRSALDLDLLLGDGSRTGCGGNRWSARFKPGERDSGSAGECLLPHSGLHGFDPESKTGGEQHRSADDRSLSPTHVSSMNPGGRVRPTSEIGMIRAFTISGMSVKGGPEEGRGVIDSPDVPGGATSTTPTSTYPATGRKKLASTLPSPRAGSR